jgi:hypothetical protein
MAEPTTDERKDPARNWEPRAPAIPLIRLQTGSAPSEEALEIVWRNFLETEDSR